MTYGKRLKSSGVSYDLRLRAIFAEAYHVQIHGLRLPRLLSLIPILVYVFGVLAILVGSLFGYWQLAFHPDRFLPFEMVGLTACALVYWRG